MQHEAAPTRIAVGLDALDLAVIGPHRIVQRGQNLRRAGVQLAARGHRQALGVEQLLRIGTIARAEDAAGTVLRDLADLLRIAQEVAHDLARIAPFAAVDLYDLALIQAAVGHRQRDARVHIGNRMPQRAEFTGPGIDIGQRAHAGGAAAHPRADAHRPVPGIRLGRQVDAELRSVALRRQLHRFACRQQRSEFPGAVHAGPVHRRDHIPGAQTRLPRGTLRLTEIRRAHHHKAVRLNGNAHGFAAGNQRALLGDLHLHLLHWQYAQQAEDQVRRSALFARPDLYRAVAAAERCQRVARIQTHASGQIKLQHGVGARRERQRVRQLAEGAHARRTQRAQRGQRQQQAQEPARFLFLPPLIQLPHMISSPSDLRRRPQMRCKAVRRSIIFSAAEFAHAAKSPVCWECMARRSRKPRMRRGSFRFFPAVAGF